MVFMSKRSEYKNLEQKLHNNSNSVILDDYLEKRFEQSVKWYIRKARTFKMMYYICSIIGISVPICIPLVYGSCFLEDGNPKKCIITILSIITSISASLISLFKAKEKWVHFRFVAEKLQSELSLFVEGVGVYSDLKTKNMEFAIQIEKIMSEEHARWINIVNNKSEKTKAQDKNE